MTTIRSKGTKTDEELAIEYKQLRYNLMRSSTFAKEYRDRGAVIIKELGQDRLDLLLFKIKTEERLEKIEATQQKIMEHFNIKVYGDSIVLPDKPWYQRLFS